MELHDRTIQNDTVNVYSRKNVEVIGKYVPFHREIIHYLTVISWKDFMVTKDVKISKTN